VDHRRIPASHQSLPRMAGRARAPGGQKPTRLDQVREAIRIRPSRVRTEAVSVSWIKRFSL
jgi:hypothetical protein